MATTTTNPDQHAAASTHEVGHRVSRNVVVSILARAGYMVSRVAIPPFVLSRMGLEAYGLWTTAFILVSYLGLSTLGISNVYIRAVAQHHARREFERANRLISTGLMVTTPLAVAIFFVCWWQWPAIAAAIRVPPHMMHEAQEAVLIVIAVFLASVAFSAFSDALNGMQMIAEAQSIWVISYVVEMGAIFLLVGMGRSIRGLAEAFLLRSLISLVLSAAYAFRRIPWLRLSPGRFCRASLRELIAFGGIFQFQSLLSIGLTSADRLAALVFTGVESAGLLDLARKWPGSLAAVPMAFFASFLPAASHLQASSSGGDDAVRRLYVDGSRYVSLLSALLTGFLAFWPAAIIHVWLNQPLAHAAALMAAFSAATHLHLLTGPGTSILRGAGRVMTEFWYTVPNLLSLVPFIYVARWVLGEHNLLGIGMAYCASMGFSALIYLWAAHRTLDVSWTEYLNRVFLPGLLAYAAGAVLMVPLNAAVLGGNRWTGMIWLAAAGIVYGVACLALAWRFVFSAGERAHIFQLLRRFTGLDLNPGVTA